MAVAVISTSNLAARFQVLVLKNGFGLLDDTGPLSQDRKNSPNHSFHHHIGSVASSVCGKNALISLRTSEAIGKS